MSDVQSVPYILNIGKLNFIMENRTELFHSIPPLPSPLPISPHTTPDLDLTPEKEYPQKTTKETHWNTKTKSRALKVIFTLNVVLNCLFIEVECSK